MGKFIRTIALGTAFSVAAMGGCSGEKSDLERVEGLDLSELPTPDRAIEKRRIAEIEIGKPCVAAIVEREDLDIKDAVSEILELPEAPCGVGFNDVMHNTTVLRTHNAEVDFAIAKASK